MQAIKEDAYWSREVITPATLRLAQARSIPKPLAPEKAGLLAEAEAAEQPSSRKKRKKVREMDDKSKHDGKVWTHNKRGLPWRCAQTGTQASAANRTSPSPCVEKGGPTNAISALVITRA